MPTKNPYGDPKKYNHFDDEHTKQLLELAHSAMAAAWRGEFDAVWKDAPLIDGKSQKQYFFEHVATWLPEVEREALRRKLHLPKAHARARVRGVKAKKTKG